MPNVIRAGNVIQNIWISGYDKWMIDFWIDNIVIYDSKISSLKRFKEDAKEVLTGFECGIMVENFNDLKVGDILENYVMEEVAAKFE